MGGGGYDRMYFNCLQIRRWAYNGGRVAFKWGEGAYKRKFTAVECHFQMSCQKYHPKIEVISSTVITCSIHCILEDIYRARILRKGIRGNVMIFFVRSPAC